ncbi:uncharacterized protein LOC115436829 [Sphaeramia orbicularis]|uniref:uncharacterized protein LOC115436829 n=1 Tax=Sphaeramia orbicularis TaxID=375764 RepID=UPI00117EFD83|nr:uncharacterized protein LOC115436829 [Sphaeramia orbicularis]
MDCNKFAGRFVTFPFRHHPRQMKSTFCSMEEPKKSRGDQFFTPVPRQPQRFPPSSGVQVAPIWSQCGRLTPITGVQAAPVPTERGIGHLPPITGVKAAPVLRSHFLPSAGVQVFPVGSQCGRPTPITGVQVAPANLHKVSMGRRCGCLDPVTRVQAAPVPTERGIGHLPPITGVKAAPVLRSHFLPSAGVQVFPVGSQCGRPTPITGVQVAPANLHKVSMGRWCGCLDPITRVQAASVPSERGIGRLPPIAGVEAAPVLRSHFLPSAGVQVAPANLRKFSMGRWCGCLDPITRVQAAPVHSGGQ